MRQMLNFPRAWLIWLMMLMAVNMAFPLLFLDRLEAQIILVSAMMGGAVMLIIFSKHGFVRLLGLGHVFWIPLLGWLWMRLPAIPMDTLFGEWILSVMVLNFISLVIDAIDVARYLLGERAPYLPSAR